MKLFHPSSVLTVALVLVLAGQAILAYQFDRAARQASPRGEQAGFPLDDAWIHQVYARSLGQSLRLEFNPGQAEVGESSLLWTAALVPAERLARLLDIPVARATRALGALVWMALALSAALLVLSLPVPGARFGAFTAALLVALDPALAFAAVSGMEPLLLALCVMVALLALARGRFQLAGIACGFAVLARPEGILLAAMIVAAVPFLRPVRPSGRAMLQCALPTLVGAAVWVTVCLSIAGRTFPNTYYAKARLVPPGEAIREGAALLLGCFERSPFYDGYAGYLFLAIGLIALASRVGGSLVTLLPLLPAVFLFGIAATRGMADPDAFYWQRYVIPALPLLHLLPAIGLAGAGAVLADLLQKGRPKPPAVEPEPSPDEADGPSRNLVAEAEAEPLRLKETPAEPALIPDLVLVVALSVLVLIPFGSAPGRLAKSVAEYAENVADVDRLNVESALWIADNPRILPQFPIATQDAGAVRYFTQGDRVIDLLGLNDHQLMTEGLSSGDVGAYIAGLEPRVMVLLDPDPGALPFWLFAASAGMREVARFGTEEYSLFSQKLPRSMVILADLPP
ncbi:MAG: hypothetical protein V2A76_09660 [Planctomycetota bacterium]